MNNEYLPAYEATPSDTLREQIMNPSIPKNEREWWAAREIEQLREAVTRLLACPAIADEDHSALEWGCEETLAAEAFARAVLEGKPP